MASTSRAARSRPSGADTSCICPTVTSCRACASSRPAAAVRSAGTFAPSTSSSAQAWQSDPSSTARLAPWCAEPVARSRAACTVGPPRRTSSRSMKSSCTSRYACKSSIPTLASSAGMELLHAYLLVHDDFMDRDEVRRGGPTVHAALERVTGSAHLGASLAVLLGSLCEAWALELVLGAKVPAERTAAAGQLLARALQDVTVGQMQDVSAPLGRDLSGDEVLAIQQMKTGGYSFELPLRLGAVLAGGSEACSAGWSASRARSAKRSRSPT